MKLYYKQMGEGEPIIILHGLFGSSDNWMTIGRKFGEEFSVFMPDLRNHGQSPHNPKWDYEVMTEDLKEFVHDMGLKKFHLIGHSMGGKVAMHYALNYPDHINKLIIIDVSPKPYPVHHDYILKGLNAVDISSLESRNEADEALSEFVQEKGVRQFLLKNLNRTNNGGYEWKLNLPVITDKIENVGEGVDSGTYEGSTLFVKGENSDYIQSDDSGIIRNVFPGSSIVTIKNAGHWIHAEKPEEFIDTVLQFLRH